MADDLATPKAMSRSVTTTEPAGGVHRPGPRRMVSRQIAAPDCLSCGQPWPCEGSWQVRAEAAEARLAVQREYDTYRRALWVMVRHFRGSVFLTSAQMEDVPLLASLGVGKEPGGIRINAGEEP